MFNLRSIAVKKNNKLRRALSYANFGKLRFKTEYEQQLWGDCSRLPTNCIIYYNASILSNLLTYRESNGNGQGAAMLKHISPVAWQHINLHGRYTFNPQDLPAPGQLRPLRDPDSFVPPIDWRRAGW